MLELPPNDFLQIGIDEAGRGALAFPVCSAGVVLPSVIPDEIRGNLKDMKLLEMIKDSKKMTTAQREKCADFIKRFAIAYSVNYASVAEIDALNIINATHLSMHRCIKDITSAENIQSENVRLLVDGDRFRPYYDDHLKKMIPFECVPKGDSIHMNIAAASILAKVGRDNFIIEYCKNNPMIDEKYGFSSHKAYGTKRHLEALKEFGPLLQIHRKTFGPVKTYMTSGQHGNEDDKNGEEGDSATCTVPHVSEEISRTRNSATDGNMNENENEISNFNKFRNFIAFRDDE